VKRVIMTIGPQYAGKSTLCAKVIAARPNIVLVSRDAILIELFGTVWLNTYTGGHHVAWSKVWEAIEEHLKRPDVTVLLDAWNGGRHERHGILSKLRILGAARVDGWYFVTPLGTCTEWSLLRDPPGEGSTEQWTTMRIKNRISEYRQCYETYHDQGIEAEPGFDSIIKINPLDNPAIETLLNF